MSITIALALPVITLEPIKHTFSMLNTSLASFFLAFFSIGILSPVKTDWFKNRSLLSKIITSAGTIEPAFNFIMSPITTFSVLMVFSLPLLSTFARLYILAFNFLLNL